jgi:hypothetical protein
VLVYDFSRCGRFQDADESAFYEYLCKRPGISAVSCAEQFEKDCSPVSTTAKGPKRAMAGEFSRELSQKVFTGQCCLIACGFRQGGPPGYGLRPMLIEENCQPKGIHERVQHKIFQTDRATLVPGPEEVAIVLEIFRSFVEGQKSETDIAENLNSYGIPANPGRARTRGTMHQIQINEKYTGNTVWNRSSFKLKKHRVQNDPEIRVRAEGAFEAVVDPGFFAATGSNIGARSARLTDEEMQAGLRELGLVEPLVVASDTSEPDNYMLLDGHLRHAILLDMGEEYALCQIMRPSPTTSASVGLQASWIIK